MAISKDMVRRLATTIKRARRAYYQGDPIMTDPQYDALFSKLQRTVEEHPELDDPSLPIHTVGVLDKKFEMQSHVTPMLSLKTIFDISEAFRWMQRTKASEVVLEPKLDGISLNLIYGRRSDGVMRLMGATLRGDGHEGESVMHATPYIRNLPTYILPRAPGWPSRLEIRGEVIFRKSIFEKLTKYTDYKNGRNAVAGLLRRDDIEHFWEHIRSKTANDLRPDFVVWGVGQGGDFAPTQSDALHELFEYEFTTHGGATVLIKNWHACDEEYFEDALDCVSCPDYENDGIVIKVNKVKEQRKLGSHRTHPYWACALKLEQQFATTILKDVVWQVGRTGRITPVAKLKPVMLQGVEIQQATLHNEEYIRKHDFRTKDRVYLERRGGVIPKVTGRVEAHYKGGKKIVPPESCPVCKTIVSFDSKGALICGNRHCRSRLIAWIEYVCKVIGIEGISGGVAKQLVEEVPEFKHPADLWDLKAECLARLDKWGGRRVEKILNEINAHKTMTMEQLLQIINVPGLGPQMAHKFAQEFVTFDRLLDFSLGKLKLWGAGVTCTANERTVLTTLRKKATRADLLRFRSVLTITGHVQAASDVLPLQGSSVMFTGSLSKPRAKYEKIVQDAGGIIKKGVSKNLDILVTGKNATEHKVEKARDLGVRVVNEDWLKEMLQ